MPFYMLLQLSSSTQSVIACFVVNTHQIQVQLLRVSSNTQLVSFSCQCLPPYNHNINTANWFSQFSNQLLLEHSHLTTHNFTHLSFQWSRDTTLSHTQHCSLQSTIIFLYSTSSTSMVPAGDCLSLCHDCYMSTYTLTLFLLARGATAAQTCDP